MRLPSIAVAATRSLPTVMALRVWLLFTLLLGAAATPILLTQVAPLADYANHLGRMHVISTIKHDPDLARLYTIHWAPIPNLIMDLIVPPLTHIVDVYTAGQIFMVLVVALVVSGPIAIQRAAFGRHSLWPLIAFPFVYNSVFMTGLVNYLFGIGVAMWALASWIALRERALWQRLAMSLVSIQILFVCHLFAAGIYGMGLLAYELWRISDSGPFNFKKAASDLIISGLPFLSIIPLLLASPTLGLSTENYWESGGKLEGLMSIFTTYDDSVDLPIAGLFAAMFPWFMRRRLLGFHPALWILLAVGGAIYLAMPRMLFGSWMADERLPVAVFFLAIGFIRLDNDKMASATFLVFVMGMSLVRFIDVEANWMHLSVATNDLRQATHLIDRGAPVLVATADQPAGTPLEDDALSHAPCLAMIERSALVARAFTVYGKQVLGVQPDYRGMVDPVDGDPPTVSQLIATTEDSVPGQPQYWDRWPDRYGYLFILNTFASDPNPDPDHLELLHAGPRYQLYRVVRDDETDEP